jgi:hypothetical protein
LAPLGCGDHYGYWACGNRGGHGVHGAHCDDLRQRASPRDCIHHVMRDHGRAHPAHRRVFDPSCGVREAARSIWCWLWSGVMKMLLSLWVVLCGDDLSNCDDCSGDYFRNQDSGLVIDLTSGQGRSWRDCNHLGLIPEVHFHILVVEMGGTSSSSWDSGGSHSVDHSMAVDIPSGQRMEDVGVAHLLND